MLADRVQATDIKRSCAEALAALPADQLPLPIVGCVLALFASTGTGSEMKQLQVRDKAEQPCSIACLHPVPAHRGTDQHGYNLVGHSWLLSSSCFEPPVYASIDACFQEKCEACVMTAFKDVVDVAMDGERLASFCSLPFVAVKIWAASDELGVDRWVMDLWHVSPICLLQPCGPLASMPVVPGLTRL